jgi:hypothetical protein
VETRTNGQQKIKANPFPNHALIKEQPKYVPNSGDYYALLMGREFLLGRFVLLLDFDNKDDGAVNGMQLIEKLNMDQYGAPCQKTSSGGKRYLLYADAAQKRRITSKTTIMHKGGLNTAWTSYFKTFFVLAPQPRLRAAASIYGPRCPATNCKTPPNSPTSSSK